MKNLTKRLAISTIAAGTLFATAFTPGAFAADDTTATVTGGSLAVTNAAADNFAGKTITGVAQTTTAAIGDFSVTDARGTGLGWRVTAQASTFAGSGTATGKSLRVGSLSMSMPTVTANGTTSSVPTVATASATIDNASALQIASAAADTGMGRYDFTATSLTLALPADVFAGTYTSTVTISALAAP